ncbi:RNAseH domain-containing protein [Streptomyces sp. SCA3-4]|nr:RNAseH domain-containing protein [Streptomyces sichuanensis]
MLRQPPDYPEALSLPLPLHLAGLDQDHVLPHRASPEASAEASKISDRSRPPTPHKARQRVA